MSKNLHDQKQTLIDFDSPEELVKHYLSQSDFPTHYWKTFFLQQRNKDITGSDKVASMIFHKNSWKLTRDGVTLFSQLFEHQKTPLKEEMTMTGRLILGLCRSISSPWYIGKNTLVTFNHITWFEIQLHDGRLYDFIDFKLS